MTTSRAPEEAASEACTSGSHRGRSASLWLCGILLATVAFWKLRIIDAASRTLVTLGSVDIYTEHYPMTRWGFEQLLAGELPHWNPYQLLGQPFLAIPYVGLLYPGNWIYAVMETAAATELSFILHLFFAGASAFVLCGTLAFSRPASLMAAFTVMWSGWMMNYANQASLISGMSWLPATVLMVELTTRGRRLAPLGLAVTVALQLLNGATEVTVQNLYVAGGYTLFRLGERAFAGEWSAALRQGIVLLGSVACGVLLAAPQFLPSLELAGESLRGSRELSFGQARWGGVVAPRRFLTDAMMAQGMVNVGILPLAGLFLGMTTRRRSLYGFALVFVVATTFLVFGGEFYRLYYETPLGSTFRRPNKFLHIYAFGQAMMAALAIFALEAASEEPRRALLRRPGFVAALLALAAGAAFLLQGGQIPWALLATLACLAAFVAVEARRARLAIIAALLVVQGVTLFMATAQPFVRPAAQLEKFEQRKAFLDELAVLVGPNRAHIEPDFRWMPAMMQKQGMLHGMRLLGDYEPLVAQRTAEFLRVAAPRAPERPASDLFHGAIDVGPRSNWKLLDLTSTRFYVLVARSPGEAFLRRLARRSARSGVIAHDRFPPVFERTTALPRAYFVPRARAVESGAEALAAIQAENFRPRREVVLEDAGPAIAKHGGRYVPGAVVEIVEDGLERVVLDVHSEGPGFLVLTDAYYPGWEAHGPGGALPIHRANYLFRAVPVPAGETRVEMRYVPRRFRTGLLLAAASALLLGAGGLYLRRNPEALRPGR